MRDKRTHSFLRTHSAIHPMSLDASSYAFRASTDTVGDSPLHGLVRVSGALHEAARPKKKIAEYRLDLKADEFEGLESGDSLSILITLRSGIDKALLGLDADKYSYVMNGCLLESRKESGSARTILSFGGLLLEVSNNEGLCEALSALSGTEYRTNAEGFEEGPVYMYVRR